MNAYDIIEKIDTGLFYDTIEASRRLTGEENFNWVEVVKDIGDSDGFSATASTIAGLFCWANSELGISYWARLHDEVEQLRKERLDVAEALHEEEEKVNEDLSITIMEEAIALKQRKSADYQGSQFSQDDYFPFGHTSYLHMLHTKMLRIRSVAEQDDANFESLEDSLIDMINYSAMYASAIRRNKV